MFKPLYPPWSNSVYWLVLGTVAAAIVATLGLLFVWVRTPFATGQQDPVDQPVKFDHRHHVKDDGIDCLYCHRNAERSPYAGVPSTELCMNCHSQIWIGSPEVAPVRRSYLENTPIAWQRVHRLPDFVYFDHSIHVTKGVGCKSCHGHVDRMPQVYQVASLQMSWCLGCHRDPDANLVPPERVTDMEWEGNAKTGRELRTKLEVNPPTDCTACHR